jgi:hypothetical protein
MFMELKSYKPAPALAGTHWLHIDCGPHTLNTEHLLCTRSLVLISVDYVINMLLSVNTPLHSVLRHQSDVKLVTDVRMRTNPSNMIMFPETEILTQVL